MHDKEGRYSLAYLLIMPRVVADQRRKFETEEAFTNLSRPCEVRYTGLPLGSDEERKARFQQDCRDGRIEISCIPSGLNFELYVAPQHVTSNSVAEGGDPNRDYIQVVADQTKVHICTHLILNGVCVRWRGWIDSNTLRGQGNVEFDEERARVEDQRLQQEMSIIQERLRILEHQQPFMHAMPIPPMAMAGMGPVASGPFAHFGPRMSAFAANYALSIPPHHASLRMPLRRSSSSSSSSPSGF